MKKQLVILAITPLLFLLLFPATLVLAEGIYSWTDEKGITHYSTSPTSEDAKPAKLPNIMKADVVIPETRQASCDDHGGVDCAAGPDRDGSVICRDGFRGVRVPFRFTCNAARVQIADVSEVDENGQFTVFLRNLESVAARGLSVTFVPGGGEEVKLNGPQDLDGFAMGEFVYQGSDYIPILNQPDAAQLVVDCLNC